MNYGDLTTNESSLSLFQINFANTKDLQEFDKTFKPYKSSHEFEKVQVQVMPNLKATVKISDNIQGQVKSFLDNHQATYTLKPKIKRDIFIAKQLYSRDFGSEHVQVLMSKISATYRVSGRVINQVKSYLNKEKLRYTVATAKVRRSVDGENAKWHTLLLKFKTVQDLQNFNSVFKQYKGHYEKISVRVHPEIQAIIKVTEHIFSKVTQYLEQHQVPYAIKSRARRASWLPSWGQKKEVGSTNEQPQSYTIKFPKLEDLQTFNSIFKNFGDYKKTQVKVVPEIATTVQVKGPLAKSVTDYLNQHKFDFTKH